LDAERIKLSGSKISRVFNHRRKQISQKTTAPADAGAVFAIAGGGGFWESREGRGGGEVDERNHGSEKSQRDFSIQPGVGAPAPTPGNYPQMNFTPTGFYLFWREVMQPVPGRNNYRT